jgi:hypothetical protein
MCWSEHKKTWFRTGDLGEMNPAGFVFLRGRLKEVCKRGGEQVALHEVDEALRSHPDVEIGVSFSVPNPFWGEEIAAVVVLRVGSKLVIQKDIITHARQQLGYDFKTPKQVRPSFFLWYCTLSMLLNIYACFAQIFFLQEDQLPRTGAGKYKRSELLRVTGAQAVDLDAMHAISGQLQANMEPRATARLEYSNANGEALVVANAVVASDSMLDVSRPDPALHGLRFMFALWTIQRHVGQLNSAWSALRNMSVSMSGFMLLAGFLLSASSTEHISRQDRVNFYVSRLGASLPVYWFGFTLAIAEFLCYCRPGNCPMDADPQNASLWWGKFVFSIVAIGTGFAFPLSSFFGYIIHGPLWFFSAYNTLLLIFPDIDLIVRYTATLRNGTVLLVLAGAVLCAYSPISFLFPGGNGWYLANRFGAPGWLATFMLGVIVHRVFARSADARATHPKRTRIIWAITTDSMSILMGVMLVLTANVDVMIGVNFGQFEHECTPSCSLHCYVTTMYI